MLVYYVCSHYSSASAESRAGTGRTISHSGWKTGRGSLGKVYPALALLLRPSRDGDCCEESLSQ